MNLNQGRLVASRVEVEEVRHYQGTKDYPSEIQRAENLRQAFSRLMKSGAAMA